MGFNFALDIHGDRLIGQNDVIEQLLY